MATKEAESTAFKLSLQQSPLDPIIVEHYQVIFKPMLTPIMDALQRSNDLVDTLRKQLEAKNQEIVDLRSEVVSLKVMYDDLEQHGRRGSMRVFGVPEHTTGTVDDKVLSLVNQHLKVTPPLVAHRLGKPPPKPFVPDPAPSEDDDDRSGNDADQSSPPPPPPTTPPRAIIIKFASRRTKSRVMRNKKNLKDNPFKAAKSMSPTISPDVEQT